MILPGIMVLPLYCKPARMDLKHHEPAPFRGRSELPPLSAVKCISACKRSRRLGISSVPESVHSPQCGFCTECEFTWT